VGVFWIDQLLPFPRSARVSCAPSLLVYDPTAVHAVADVHDTPFSWLAAPPSGLGVPWIDQPAPFQRSAKVTAAPVLSEYDPTAVHIVAAVHDTPFNGVAHSPLHVD
jgi:hypothetical protein